MKHSKILSLLWQRDYEVVRTMVMKSQNLLCILFFYSLMTLSCAEDDADKIPDNFSEKITFMVMNRTGHNGPASTNCGGEPETVEFTFITPAEKFIQIIAGDTQEFIGLEIVEGQSLTVVVRDPVTKEELVSKTTLFNPTENNLPEVGDPLIRLCPKTQLEFKYF